VGIASAVNTFGKEGLGMGLADRARVRAATKRSALLSGFLSGFRRPTKIIDLGGTFAMWQRWGLAGDNSLSVTLANNFASDTNAKSIDLRFTNFSRLDIDVLELDDNSYKQFDLIFSNSMLEHLPTRRLQQRLADSITSSGRPYFIQVPNKYSMIDPHFAHPLAPFFASWPKPLQMRMLLVSGLNGGGRHRSLDTAARRLEFYCPLGKTEMKRLFPGAKVSYEWSYGIPMSIVARRGSGA
jgi:hypothetical protein